MSKKSQRIRKILTREAARLMYEEEVKQFFTAKRLAAKRIFGHQGGRALRYRPQDLPSNGEIHDALLELARLTEGQFHEQRLFAMRVVALEVMQALAPFQPRLIGSVSTGHVRRGSDIDLHVFTDDLEQLEKFLWNLGWTYECDQVTIRNNGEFKDYSHIYLEHLFPVELSVYEPYEMRIVQRSSTNGKPIVRLKAAALQSLLQQQHVQLWESYLQTGIIPDLERLQEDDVLPTLADIEALAEQQEV